MNIFFPKLNDDQSFQFIAKFGLDGEIDLEAINEYAKKWVQSKEGIKTQGRTYNEEFEGPPEVNIFVGNLLFQFKALPSSGTEWKNRRWKDWFVLFTSDLYKSGLPVGKLIKCESIENI